MRKPRNMTGSALCIAVAWLWLGAFAATARAQAEVMPLRVGAVIGVATMVSKDQVGRLEYDSFGPMFEVEAGYSFTSWLDAQLVFATAAFPAPRGTGGLLSPIASLRVQVPSPTVRPYVQLDVGPGFTGPLMRPLFRSAIGIELQASNLIALGPKLGYGHMFQTNGRGDSTDARFFFLGVGMSFWPGGREKLRPVVHTRTRTRTVRELEIREVVREPPMSDDQLNALLDDAVPAARVELLAPVLFRFDSDVLEPIGVAMLHEVAHELAQRPDILLLEIQGYADQRGSDEYNQALSQRRALRVQQWLVEHGVDAQRLVIAAEGAKAPVEREGTERAHEQNRRVVFRVKKMKGGGE